ncbi:MAG: hypothetical protein KGI89_02945 [Euryarchaeota archaeon]|nr:hypothetical protein [Euryarchaeota archaeon]
MKSVFWVPAVADKWANGRDPKTQNGLLFWRSSDFVQCPEVMAVAPKDAPYRWRTTLGLRGTRVFFPFVPLDPTGTAFAATAARDGDVLLATTPGPLEVLKLGNRGFKVYGFLDGTTFEEMDERKLELDLAGVDGYVFPAWDDPMVGLRRITYRVERLRDSPVHFLRAQGLERMWLTALLAEQKTAETTGDVATHLAGDSAQTYILPGEFGHSIRCTKTEQWAGLPCDCPVCSVTTPETMVESSPHRVLHNLIELLKIRRLLDAVQHERTWFTSRAPKATRRAIELWGLYEKDGLEAIAPRWVGEGVPQHQHQLAEWSDLPPLPPCVMCGRAEADQRHSYGDRFFPVCRNCKTRLESVDLLMPVVEA